MTYEAPPDNNHKVVRLHGTTESLPAEGLPPFRALEQAVLDTALARN